MAWLHDLDPVAFSIGPLFGIGPLHVHWYGISYIVGLLLGWLCLRMWQKQGRLPSTDPTFVGDFVTTIGIAMVIGGRLGYCVFYDRTLLGPIGEFPYWGVLAVHHGGMASHGGLIGFAIGNWLFCRKRGLTTGVTADAIAAAAPLGALCGRIANFVNGELYGRPTGSTWGVIFPEQRRHMDFAEIQQRAHELNIERVIVNEPKQMYSPEWYEWLRLGVPCHPSQLYAAVLEGALLAAIVIPLHLRHRRPWFTAGLCFSLYSVGRFVGEFWRLPDAGQPGGPPAMVDGVLTAVPPVLGFMSKGQVLTIPFFIVGVALMIWAWRRGPRPEAYRPAPALAAPPSSPA